jgi:hypothetical protein
MLTSRRRTPWPDAASALRPADIAHRGRIAAAACRDVGIYGIGGYFLKRAPRPGIMLGYPRLRPGDICEGVRRLADVL